MIFLVFFPCHDPPTIVILAYSTFPFGWLLFCISFYLTIIKTTGNAGIGTEMMDLLFLLLLLLRLIIPPAARGKFLFSIFCSLVSYLFSCHIMMDGMADDGEIGIGNVKDRVYPLRCITRFVNIS
jgi:hypothetical protein